MNGFELHGIKHLSPSQINAFIEHPFDWVANKLFKVYTPGSPPMFAGNAVESGIEHGLINQDAPFQDCLDITLAEYDASVAKLNPGPLPMPNEAADKKRLELPGMVQNGLDLLRPLGPPDIPTEITNPYADRPQHKVELKLEGVGVPVLGYIDFLYPKQGLIVDLKTTARMPNNGQISDPHAMQGSLYWKAHANHAMKFAYVTKAKSLLVELENPAFHLRELTNAAITMNNFLSLSADKYELIRGLFPKKNSFKWVSATNQRILADFERSLGR